VTAARVVVTFRLIAGQKLAVAGNEGKSIIPIRMIQVILR
jgi:hypothetical protein